MNYSEPLWHPPSAVQVSAVVIFIGVVLAVVCAAVYVHSRLNPSAEVICAGGNTHLCTAVLKVHVRPTQYAANQARVQLVSLNDKKRVFAQQNICSPNWQTLTFEPPNVPGNYQFVYVVNNECVKDSGVVILKPVKLEVVDSEIMYTDPAIVKYETASHRAEGRHKVYLVRRDTQNEDERYASEEILIDFRGTFRFEGTKAPELPGKYYFQYVIESPSNNVVEVASTPDFTVKGPQLEVCKQDLYWAQQFTVRVVAPYSRSNSDYIAWSDEKPHDGQCRPNYCSFCYVPPGQRETEVHFNSKHAPQRPGPMYIMYVSDSLNKRVMACICYMVKPPALMLHLMSDTFSSRNEAMVKWGHNVEVRVLSSSNRSPKDMLVLQSLNIPSSASDVSIPLPVPAGTPADAARGALVEFGDSKRPPLPGEYVVRYFAHGYPQAVAQSKVFLVKGPQLQADAENVFWNEDVSCLVSDLRVGYFDKDWIVMTPVALSGQEMGAVPAHLHPDRRRRRVADVITADQHALTADNQLRVWFKGADAPPYSGMWRFLYVYDDRVVIEKSDPFLASFPTLTVHLRDAPEGSKHDKIVSVQYRTTSTRDTTDCVCLTLEQDRPDPSDVHVDLPSDPHHTAGIVEFTTLPDKPGRYQVRYARFNSGYFNRTLHRVENQKGQIITISRNEPGAAFAFHIELGGGNAQKSAPPLPYEP